MLPCPDEGMLARAAEAVVAVLRGHPHVYAHSLRYLRPEAQDELARRIARGALFAAWLLPDHESMQDFRVKIRKARWLIERAAVRADAAEERDGARWCPGCRAWRSTRYDRGRIALVCTSCDAVTMPRAAAGG